MTHFLITAATGLLGNRISEMRIEQGVAAPGVDNLNNNCEMRMQDICLRKLQALPGSAFQELFISERCSVKKIPAFDGMRYVVESYPTERTWAKEVATL